MSQEIEIQIKTAIDTANSAQKVGQLKNSLVELQNIAQRSDLGKEQQKQIQQAITETTKKMASLKEKIGDIGDEVKTLDGSPVERLKNSFGLLGDGILKLDFQKVIVGLRGIGAAIAANPIGAIATAVLTLVSAFGGLEAILGVVTSALDFIIKPIRELFESFDKGSEKVKKAGKEIVNFDNLLLRGAELSASKAAADIENRINLLKEQGATQRELINQEILLNEAKNNALAETEKKLFNKRQNLLALITGNTPKELLDDIQKQQLEIDNTILDLQIQQIKNTGDNAALAAKLNNDIARDEIKLRLKLLEEEQEARILLTEKGSTKRLETELKAIDIIEEFQVKYAKALEITENGITIIKQNNIEKRKKLEEEYYKFTSTLKKIDIEEITIAGEAQRIKDEDELKFQKMASNMLIQFDNARFVNKAKKRKEDLDNEIKTIQIIRNISESAFTSIISLSDSLFQIKMNNLKKGSEEEEKVAKKQFQVNKALSLSSAVVTGVLTTMEAYYNGMKNPVPLLGPATAIVYATLAGLTSLANIAKIASTKFETKTLSPSTSGGGGGGGGAAPDVQTPTFTPTSFFGLGQTTQFNPQEQGPTRVYVTEGDISNTQNRVRVVENRARFG